jgi:hypothetical protein
VERWQGAQRSHQCHPEGSVTVPAPAAHGTLCAASALLPLTRICFMPSLVAGLAPDHRDLGHDKEANCELGITRAFDNFEIPRLIDADDMASTR